MPLDRRAHSDLPGPVLSNLILLGRSLGSQRHSLTPQTRRTPDSVARTRPLGHWLSKCSSPHFSPTSSSGAVAGGDTAAAAAACVAAVASAAAGHTARVASHRIDAWDDLSLHIPLTPPMDVLVDAAATESYRRLFSFNLRVVRASRTLHVLYAALSERERQRGSGEGGGGSVGGSVGGGVGGGSAAVLRRPPRALHMLRLHMHELGHFVQAARAHFADFVCGACWRQLRASLAEASTLSELRAAHAAYLEAASRRCLLLPADAAASQLVAAALGLVLALRRAIVAGGPTVSREVVTASRLQFAAITKGLAAANHPLAALYRG